MSLGSNILHHRKRLGISQEELGKKLFVSRQTISLWEKDQTVPTTENLMRLGEIFSVSVDELLKSETEKSAENPDEPKERYTLRLSESDLKTIKRNEDISLYKSRIGRIVFLVIIGIFYYTSNVEKSLSWNTVIYLCIMIWLISPLLRDIFLNERVWLTQQKRILETEYEYDIYDTFMELKMYRDNELRRYQKVYYDDILCVRHLDHFISIQFGNEVVYIKKEDLKDSSILYSYMYKNPTKEIKESQPVKWKLASDILFLATILSLFAAMSVTLAYEPQININESVTVGADGKFAPEVVEQMNEETKKIVCGMWKFFLFLPVPLSSIGFGIALKKKGYKYKKNIVIGVIVAALLIIYGSFSIIFPIAMSPGG